MTLVHLTLFEMRRAIHRRVVWWMCVLALVGCAFTGVIVYVTSANPDPFLDPTHPARMVTWTFESDNGGFLGVAAVFLAIGAAICGASVAGAEWKAGTVGTVLTWTPSRWRLHTARTISAAVWSFVIGFALQIVFLGACLPAVLANGSTDGTDGEWRQQLVLGMLRICVTTSLIAVLAFSIATIGRNTAPALVGLAIWALVLENLIRGLKPKTGRFLITENVGTFVGWESLDDLTFHRGPVLALATLVFYLIVFAVIALLTFTRRDITGAA